MGHVIHGVNTLFTRYVMVDFEKDSYAYLTGTIPQRASKRIPVRFAFLIIACVTSFGNVCTKTYSLSGKCTTQILSIQMDGQAMRPIVIFILMV